MIRIALVDDHAVFRRSLRSLLEGQAEFSVVAEAGDGFAAIELVKQHRPDVLIMDVTLPKLDGLGVTRIVRSQHPGTKVILLSLSTDDGTRVAALEAGAYRCLPKNAYLSGMLAVIRECCKEPLRDALNNAVRAFAKAPGNVTVEEIQGTHFKTFAIGVALVDHEWILSNIETIKTCALRVAGVDEIINLFLNESSFIERHQVPESQPLHPQVPTREFVAERDGLQSMQDALRSLVQTIAQKYDEVIVAEPLPGKAFEIKVALTDYNAVLSKIHVIKTFAMQLAGLPEEQSVFINLVVNDRGQSSRPPQGVQLISEYPGKRTDMKKAEEDLLGFVRAIAMHPDEVQVDYIDSEPAVFEITVHEMDAEEAGKYLGVFQAVVGCRTDMMCDQYEIKIRVS